MIDYNNYLYQIIIRIKLQTYLKLVIENQRSRRLGNTHCTTPTKGDYKNIRLIPFLYFYANAEFDEQLISFQFLVTFYDLYLFCASPQSLYWDKYQCWLKTSIISRASFYIELYNLVFSIIIGQYVIYNNYSHYL